MKKSIAYALTAMLLAAPIASTVCAAQDPGAPQKLDAATLTSAAAIPQMIVDPDGTLHFGPRTVPPPALYSEAGGGGCIKRVVESV
jgi:hypothetical protein